MSLGFSQDDPMMWSCCFLMMVVMIMIMLLMMNATVKQTARPCLLDGTEKGLSLKC